MAEPSDIQVSKCIACKEAISTGATICSKCSSYQTQWKNELRYAANVVGIFTVSASLIVYIISTIPDLRKVLSWSDDLRVVSFAQHRDITVLNTGDGTVFLSHVSIRTDQGAADTFFINRPLNPGEVLTHKADPEQSNRLGLYGLMSGVPLDDWDRKVHEYGSASDPEDRIVSAVLHEEDPQYVMYKDYYGDGFQTIGATALLHFFPLRKRETKTLTIPVRGILLENPNDKCNKK